MIAAVYPFLYAATSFTFFTDEPRYLTFIAPVLALLLATLLRRPRVAVGALAVAVAWTAFYLVRLEDQGRFRYLGQPADMGPLIALLERGRTGPGLRRLLDRVSAGLRERRADRRDLDRVRPEPGVRRTREGRPEPGVRLRRRLPAGRRSEARLEPRGYRQADVGRLDRVRSALMDVLGLIPARGGSKGIPRKNLVEVGGQAAARVDGRRGAGRDPSSRGSSSRPTTTRSRPRRESRCCAGRRSSRRTTRRCSTSSVTRSRSSVAGRRRAPAADVAASPRRARRRCGSAAARERRRRGRQRRRGSASLFTPTL